MRVAVKLLRILWGMAVQYHDPRLFFNHYPDKHATDQAWSFSADAIRATFEEAGLTGELLKELLQTHDADLDQYAIISAAPNNEFVVRLMAAAAPWSSNK